MADELPIDSPFDLDLTLEYDQGHRWRPDREHHGWYTSVLDGEFVRIHQKTVDDPVNFEPGTTEIEEKLRWQFRVDDNISAIYDELADDSTMAALLHRYYGLRIMKCRPVGVSGVLYPVGPQPLPIACCNHAYCQRDGRDR